MGSRLYFRARIGDRYTAVRALLEAWAEDEGHRISDRVVLVKPNCVSAHRQLASTNAEVVHAALEVLGQLHPKRLILAEGSSEDTLQAFRNFGYLTWAEKLGAEILDLNQDASVVREVYDAQGNPIPVRVAKTALQSFRVSLAKPKTHDCVIVTLGIKNLVVGAIQKPDKFKIHQGYVAINLNIALLARKLAPNLTVVDGFEGMEGDGPVGGAPVPHRFALVGGDPVAVDAATATLMGFNPRVIGYLVHCSSFQLGQLEQWEVVGDPLDEAIRQYRSHSTYAQQLHWGLSEALLRSKL